MSLQNDRKGMLVRCSFSSHSINSFRANGFSTTHEKNWKPISGGIDMDQWYEMRYGAGSRQVFKESVGNIDENHFFHFRFVQFYPVLRQIIFQTHYCSEL